MKKYAAIIALLLLSLLGLSGCGSDTGGGPPGVATKAVAKIYLFGAMSSSSRVATIQTSFVVPSGVLVNYSSPAPSGYPASTYPLKGGTVLPSGPVQVAASDISGIYNTSTGMVSISLVNSPTNGSLRDLHSSVAGDGTEVAEVFFKLATPGVLPNLPNPWQDLSVTVWQQVPTVPIASLLPLSGCRLNLKAVYQ